MDKAKIKRVNISTRLLTLHDTSWLKYVCSDLTTALMVTSHGYKLLFADNGGVHCVSIESFHHSLKPLISKQSKAITALMQIISNDVPEIKGGSRKMSIVQDPLCAEYLI